MDDLLQNNDYITWLIALKSTIAQRQIKAGLAVNSTLIELYWDLGEQIVEKQANAKWGLGFMEQLSKDLQAEFPEMSGFSISNLKYCRQFYLAYYPKSQQLVGELPKLISKQLFNIPFKNIAK